ncbi:uncharacterized protein LOC105262198 [Musca domestica]|uniref:Uncharacterized protein LOC105262198 n=1 Tax=Musca domestica TaxID=7370 RepID=A0A1I8NKC8_MUSDO|nr:uncharacterized protein LOC105262198 [Musca domestica]
MNFKIPPLYLCAILILIGVLKLAQAEIFNVEDITIETKTSNFRCDRIVCPQNTHRCVVTKTSRSKDLSRVKRRNICYSRDKEILQKSKNYEHVKGGSGGGKPIYFRLDVEHSGKVNVLTWDKPKKTSRNLEKIKENMIQKIKELKNNL